jgi:hypothetical protein
MTGAASLLLLIPIVALGPADRDASVAAGRDALDRWIWEYPWYDAETDDVRAVEVSEPWHLKWEWFWDWLDGLFGTGVGGGGSISWLKWLIWSGMAAVLIVLVYFLVRAFLIGKGAPSGAAAHDAASEKAELKRRVEALPPGARRPSDLLGEARWHYERGNYREAIVYLFSHQLVELDKNQLIRLAKGKTNRQYLRELGRRIPLRRLLQQTMVAFEEVFFGNYAINRPRFESIWSRLGEFEALLAGGDG